MTPRLEEVVALVRRVAEDDDGEDALDLIYYEFDLAFREGRFEEADAIFATLDPKEFLRAKDGSVVIILAFMSISKAAEDKLPARAGYVQRVHAFLEGNPRRERLMAGIA